MKKFRNICLIVLILFVILIVSFCIYYNVNVSAVDKNDSTKIEVVIPSGSSKKKVGEILAQKDLIRSSNFFNLYVKLFSVGDLKASTYYLSRDMNLKEIIKELEKGNDYNPDQISITFPEGINIRRVATLIDQATVHSYDDVLNLLKDEAYLDTLIEKYWFLTEEIKNPELYYSLEGYFFPDTYYFSSEKVSLSDIFTKMLDQMGKVLSPYRETIQENGYSIHQILTLASLVEKEGKEEDFTNIASVLYNRLHKKMKLELCSTAYYGMGMDFNEVGIATSEMISNRNSYNTYQLPGLPSGPISLPSKAAILAVISPSETENLFFLSDNQGKSYFFKTYQEHQQKQKELMASGKWNR